MLRQELLSDATILDTVTRLRALVHSAKPTWAPPHAYMNSDYPLTAQLHEFEAGALVARTPLLRHALAVLDDVEQMPPEAGVDRFGMLASVLGVLWVYGIDGRSAFAEAVSEVA